MNEADPKPINLDELRLLPDWLREDQAPPSKQYASHDFPMGEENANRRGGRPGGFGRDRREGGRAPGGPSAGPRRDGGRSGPPPRGGQGRPNRDDRRGPAAPVAAPPQPAPVRVEFLPDERCLGSINKQIRSTHLAYPLFGLARMFLQEPERHWVQFTLATNEVPAGAVLYQLGEDGPISLERQTLEKLAFDLHKDRFYTEQTEQKEPLKGNFTNVARCRLSGTLLGPTNHHGYQPALRALYESRFSRRMPFEEFKRSIEVVTDPALIERWKEEARTTTTIAIVGEETPTVLATVNDAKAHFRQHHLEGLLRIGTTLKVHGSVARNLPEPAMMHAIRDAHERELRYPAQFVQLLRQGFQDSGLHIFKHRKRVVYVSLARPVPFIPHGAVSENVTAILAVVAESPLCTRKAIAERVLGKTAEAKLGVPSPAAPVAGQDGVKDEPSSGPTEEIQADETQAPTPVVVETPAKTEDPAARAKAALAADLRFLVQSGHIIEFHNGTFDLPLSPKAKDDAPMPARHPSAAKGAPATTRSEDTEKGSSAQGESTPEEPDTAEDDVAEGSTTLATESETVESPGTLENDIPAATAEMETSSNASSDVEAEATRPADSLETAATSDTPDDSEREKPSLP